jgi:GntR family transcriptional regulator, transcriptional repressor for pyruvate dehydrogenase complex
MREAAERGLGPGDHLAAEHELIDRLGVARGSIREGLRLLEALGVVSLRRGSGGGTTLSKPRPEQLASSIAMMLQLNDGTLGTVLEARNVIEPTMAAFAAQRRTDEHIAEMHDCIAMLRASIKDSTRFHVVNRRFHDLVAEASGNALLTVLMPSLNWMSAAVGWELPERVRKRVAEEKALIVDAIEAGDSWMASERMRRMVMAVEEIERYSPGFLSQPIVWADVDELLADHFNDNGLAPAPSAVAQRSAS